MMVNVTGRFGTPLQESLTQARRRSGAGPPVSARWLLPEPMLIWPAGAGLAEAQKKILPTTFELVTSTRLLPHPASPPSVQETLARPLPSVSAANSMTPERPEAGS